MLDILKDKPGLTVNELTSRFAMSRIGAMKHLKVLELADLVRSAPDAQDGRMRRLYLNVIPIQRIHERWTTRYGAHFASQLLRFQDAVERGATGKRKGRPGR